MPTLIIKGQCDYVSWTSACAYLEALSDTTFVYLQDVVRNAYQDPDVVVESVRSFFQGGDTIPLERHDTSMSDLPGAAMTRPSLQPPLRGDWLALNPPGHPPHVHDLVGIDPDIRSIATGRFAKFFFGLLRAEDVFGWSFPVLAPLDGQVVTSHDDEPDKHRLLPIIDGPASLLRPLFHRDRVEKVAGNHVVLSTAAGFILLAHLRAGSLTVGNGDKVQSGQPVGLVGNSGNSIGPHLHIQVMDGPDPHSSNVTPFRLGEFYALEGETWRHHRDASLPDRATRIRFAS